MVALYLGTVSCFMLGAVPYSEWCHILHACMEHSYAWSGSERCMLGCGHVLCARSIDHSLHPSLSVELHMRSITACIVPRKLGLILAAD